MKICNKTLFAGLLIISLQCACTKELNIDSTKAVGDKNFWTSYRDTRAALMGTYGLLRAALSDNGCFWMYGELRNGDFVSVQRPDLDAIIQGKLNAAYPLFNALTNWRRFYAVINASNIFLERVGDVKKNDPKYSDQNMRVDIGQIRFLRAFAYFYLVTVWGDVPFVRQSHDGSFENRPREDKEKILAFVESEMLAAAADLPYNYSADDPQQLGDYYNEPGSRWVSVLARKLSVYGVLAHVAAWRGDYRSAVTYSKFVLDNYNKSGMYFEPDTYWISAANGMFQGHKTNQLFGLNFEFDNQDATFEGHIEDFTLAEPFVRKALPDIFVPRDSILSVFSAPSDLRFSLDTLTGKPNYTDRWFSNFNSDIPIFCKIKVIQKGGTDPSFRLYSSCLIYTRLEEIDLLYAESLAVTGNTDGAIDALNNIRRIRNVNSFKAGGNEDLIDAIFQERRKEMMGEAHRWFDLVRYNKIKRNNSAFMKLISEGGIYWPVSADILRQNPLIKQNPYWK
ncbi:putative outer membrane starch-binding protein [Chitinophaga polysaccharea]|uniref:Putative outer membrane starch-binding protein n=1 Tax=Chitinophaga polysaccharea TaxID=1293035 RepID=A0A561PC40_9BACT|nr:RagB/SusD family nutrient uptake outer membrane protein [Chitinophaga polysaccharea]TWF35697.1 putative outer membrane starch-binding protein [Chitinophaga polysaccharea]